MLKELIGFTIRLLETAIVEVEKYQIYVRARLSVPIILKRILNRKLPRELRKTKNMAVILGVTSWKFICSLFTRRKAIIFNMEILLKIFKTVYN